MTTLDKAAILAAKDMKLEALEVPEWGGTVYVRVMSGAERDSFEADCTEVSRKGSKPKLENIRAKLAVRVLCDQNGNRLFADSDAAELGKKNSKAIDRVWESANRLNALRTADVEELAKN